MAIHLRDDVFPHGASSSLDFLGREEVKVPLQIQQFSVGLIHFIFGWYTIGVCFWMLAPSSESACLVQRTNELRVDFPALFPK
jgi:hypothetical protein